MCARVLSFIQVCVRTCEFSCVRARVSSGMPTYIRARVGACVCALFACVREFVPVCVSACVRELKCVCERTCVRM